MFWDKKKYKVKSRGGKIQFNTKEIRGVVEHLIVKPHDSVMWSMIILDKDGDEIYDRRGHLGRLDDKDGLPVGTDTQEKVTVKLFDITENTEFDIIFRVREMT